MGQNFVHELVDDLVKVALMSPPLWRLQSCLQIGLSFFYICICIMLGVGQVTMSDNPHVYLATPLFFKIIPKTRINGKILHDCLQLFHHPRPHMFVQGQLVSYMILPSPFKPPIWIVESFVFATFYLSQAWWTCQRHAKIFTPSHKTYNFVQCMVEQNPWWINALGRQSTWVLGNFCGKSLHLWLKIPLHGTRFHNVGH